MAHFSAATPKRHFAYANSQHILRVDRGVLQWKNRLNKGQTVQTAVKYKSKSGKTCYKGTPALKKTENLGFDWFLEGFPTYIARIHQTDRDLKCMLVNVV